MKINMKKLTDPNDTHNSDKMLVTSGIIFTLCMIIFELFTVTQQMSVSDNVSADALFLESNPNPLFTVQHMANVETPYIQEGEGEVTVLSDKADIRHTTLNNGIPATTTAKINLYADYETDWNTTRTLAEASFLNGADGSSLKGWNLTEVWFGSNKNSKNQSDFLVVDVPYTDNVVDLSKVSLTNNPNHPNLSSSAGGYYVADENGCYTICILDRDVVRLMFEAVNSWEYNAVDVFDYDVSDGGYYLSEDFYNKGILHATSEQCEEKDMVCVDATANGIHSSENYSGEGAKFSFGGSSIGTNLETETLDHKLDTINVFNTWDQDRQENAFGTGVTLGLTSGIKADGSIVWTDGISAPDLFGDSNVKGKTAYTNTEYTLTFAKNGFTKTLSSVESSYGTAAEGLESLGESFWIMDGAPSYATDGHDVAWGSDSRYVKYYLNGDLGPDIFETSDDGEDHNSFFGFSYTENFTLSAGYTGPLNFFGYSDDDLWVYAARVDENNNVIEDTVKLVADLGGVHNETAYYCDLWNTIEPVKYGEEDQKWRIFVFWLERDGSSAKCYLKFTLPEAAIIDKHDTSYAIIKALDFSLHSKNQTFLFNNGTSDRYTVMFDNGNFITITSGEEFTVPAGLLITINDLIAGSEFTITEIGKSRIWGSTGYGYEETDTLSGKSGTDELFYFLSADSPGQNTEIITMKQSVSGDWGMSDITTNTGALISYNITVTNTNDTDVDIEVTTVVPDGLEVIESSLFDGQVLDENVLSCSTKLEAGSKIELSFTCNVITEDVCDIENKANILINGVKLAESNTVTAKIIN